MVRRLCAIGVGCDGCTIRLESDEVERRRLRGRNARASQLHQPSARQGLVDHCDRFVRRADRIENALCGRAVHRPSAEEISRMVCFMWMTSFGHSERHRVLTIAEFRPR